MGSFKEEGVRKGGPLFAVCTPHKIIFIKIVRILLTYPSSYAIVTFIDKHLTQRLMYNTYNAQTELLGMYIKGEITQREWYNASRLLELLGK